MCAIFGYFKPGFPAGVNKPRLIRHLARKCQTYGDKSFGLFGKVAGELKLEKYTGPASSWIQSQTEKQMKAWGAGDVILGHTRWPTKGAITKANCHPFHLGDWIACHNGCISNSGELMLEATLAPKGETDSEEALSYVVSENWSKESMGNLRGGFAFGGISRDLTKGILVCDDRQRLSYVKIGAGFVWCTDGQALTSSLRAAGYTGELAVKRLSSQILHLHTGVLEDLGAARVEIEEWEENLLRESQTGGSNGSSLKRGSGRVGPSRSSSKRELEFPRTQPHFTSTPLDLSLGRQLTEEARQLELNRVVAEFKAESQEEGPEDLNVQAGEEDAPPASDLVQ